MPSPRRRLVLAGALACGAGALLAATFVEGEGGSLTPPVLSQAPHPTPATRAAVHTTAGSSLDDPAVLASLERIAARALERSAQPTLEEVVEGARGRSHGDLLVALERHLRTAPEDGERLVDCMRRETDRSRFFVMARALGRTLDRPRVRASTLELLREVEPARRADGLVALMGRSEPQVAALLLEVLEGDPSEEARRRSAALLARVLDEVDPASAQRARWTARATLTTPHAPASRIAGAAELLGRPGADPQDLELLRSELMRTDDPEVLASTAYGLAMGGLAPDGLRDLLTARQSDPRLEGVVGRLLAAIP